MSSQWWPLITGLSVFFSLLFGIWVGREGAKSHYPHRRDYDRDQIIALILGGMRWHQTYTSGGWTESSFMPPWVEKVADEIVEVHK